MSKSWELTQTELIRTVFNRYAKGGTLDGEDAAAILITSRLSPAVLARIFDLSDKDNDGKLTELEFVVAFHLCICVAKRGLELPSQMPEILERWIDEQKGRRKAKFTKGAHVIHHRQSDGFQREGVVVGVHADDIVRGFYYTVRLVEDDSQELQANEERLTDKTYKHDSTSLKRGFEEVQREVSFGSLNLPNLDHETSFGEFTSSELTESSSQTTQENLSAQNPLPEQTILPIASSGAVPNSQTSDSLYNRFEPMDTKQVIENESDFASILSPVSRKVQPFPSVSTTGSGDEVLSPPISMPSGLSTDMTPLEQSVESSTQPSQRIALVENEEIPDEFLSARPEPVAILEHPSNGSNPESSSLAENVPYGALNAETGQGIRGSDDAIKTDSLDADGEFVTSPPISVSTQFGVNSEQSVFVFPSVSKNVGVTFDEVKDNESPKEPGGLALKDNSSPNNPTPSDEQVVTMVIDPPNYEAADMNLEHPVRESANVLEVNLPTSLDDGLSEIHSTRDNGNLETQPSTIESIEQSTKVDFSLDDLRSENIFQHPSSPALENSGGRLAFNFLELHEVVSTPETVSTASRPMVSRAPVNLKDDDDFGFSTAISAPSLNNRTSKESLNDSAEIVIEFEPSEIQKNTKTLGGDDFGDFTS